MHRVVKPFPYSVDGFTLVSLVEGDERDFGDMAAGLAAEGWIEPAGRRAVETPVESAMEFAVANKPPVQRKGK